MLYRKIPNLGGLLVWYFGIVARHHTRLDTVHLVRIVPRKKPSSVPWYATRPETLIITASSAHTSTYCVDPRSTVRTL